MTPVLVNASRSRIPPPREELQSAFDELLASAVRGIHVVRSETGLSAEVESALWAIEPGSDDFDDQVQAAKDAFAEQLKHPKRSRSWSSPVRQERTPDWAIRLSRDNGE